MVKNPNWKDVQSVGYFTSAAEDVNLGLPRTNTPIGLSRTCTQGLQITSPSF